MQVLIMRQASVAEEPKLKQLQLRPEPVCTQITSLTKRGFFMLTSQNECFCLPISDSDLLW